MAPGLTRSSICVMPNRLIVLEFYCTREHIVGSDAVLNKKKQNEKGQEKRPAMLSQAGATSVEYGLIGGLLALALFVGTQIAGNGINQVFALIGLTVQNATNTAEQNTGN
jgi:Flp pilus assembly pilin Flp